MSCRTQMHHSVENLDSRFSWIKFFQKYKTETASVYKKRQSQRYFGNQNWHTKPRRLTRLSQFHTPFVLTIHIRLIYLNVILLVFLVFKADVFNDVSHLNSVSILQFPILFTCQLQRSRLAAILTIAGHPFKITKGWYRDTVNWIIYTVILTFGWNILFNPQGTRRWRFTKARRAKQQ